MKLLSKTILSITWLAFIAYFQPISTVASASQTSSSAAENLIIESDGIKLAASLLQPENANGIGVVMLPGSGPAERRIIRPAAEQLVQAGITALVFDKRGSGDSEGDWTKTSLSELAGDAIAAMSVLRGMASLSHIGLWGHSQGNWVATRSIDIGGQPDFVVAVSGGGSSPREAEIYNYRHNVSSFTTAEQNTAMTLVDLYFDYLSGKTTRAELDRHIEPVKSTDWYQQLGIANVLISETFRPKWQWVADYDPAQSTTNINIPVLVLLGGADHLIPLDLTIADWNQQLATNTASGSRIVTFVGRDHHLRVAEAGHGYGVSTDPTIWKVITDWLGEQFPDNN